MILIQAVFVMFVMYMVSKCKVVGSEALKAMVMKRCIFWYITPCRPVKVNRQLGGMCLLHLQLVACFMLVSCLAFSSTLKMEAAYSSEMSDEYRQTTRRYIPVAELIEVTVGSGLLLFDPEDGDDIFLRNV
jgi:hypothetical protein